MSENVSTITMLFEKAEDYGKTTLELIKMEAIDKSADVVSSLVSRIVICVAVAIFILVISIGCALWIGELLGKSYFGFFVIGGFYGILIVLLVAFRHQWLKYPVSNSIINQMLKQKIK